MQPLVSTSDYDSGDGSSIYVRDASGVWTLAYTVNDGSPGRNQTQIKVVPSAPNTAIGINVDTAHIYLSSNGGKAWAFNNFGNGLLAEQETDAIDEDGNLYSPFGSNYPLHKSTDYGNTSKVFFIPSAEQGGFGGGTWASDGVIAQGGTNAFPGPYQSYLWWLDYSGNLLFTTIGADESMAQANQYGLVVGKNGSQLIVTIATQSVAHPTGTITVFDTTLLPGNPQLRSVTPFGVELVLDACPVTHTVLLAHTVDPTSSYAGSIWRSTDQGATWTRVVGPTANLAKDPTATYIARSIAVDLANPPADCWVASATPHAFHSTDQGTTWSQESVGSPPDPYFFSITMVGPNLTLSSRASALPL